MQLQNTSISGKMNLEQRDCWVTSVSSKYVRVFECVCAPERAETAAKSVETPVLVSRARRGEELKSSAEKLSKRDLFFGKQTRKRLKSYTNEPSAEET